MSRFTILSRYCRKTDAKIRNFVALFLACSNDLHVFEILYFRFQNEVNSEYPALTS